MEIANRAQGRWHGILHQVGIDPKRLRNRNGPCPGCGGSDRFRFDDKDGRGTFYCNGGGDPVAGDGFGLLKHVLGVGFPAAARLVEEALGGRSDRPPIIPRRSPPAPKPKTNPTAQRIWQATRPDELRSWDAKVSSHPYAKLKGIEHACGAARGWVNGRVVGNKADCLIVPLRNLKREFAGVEVIGTPVWNPEKKKHTTPKQTFGSKGLLVLGNTLDTSLDVHICEGWADACSIWKAHGNVVVIAVFRGVDTQMKLAEALDLRDPARQYVIHKDA